MVICHPLQIVLQLRDLLHEMELWLLLSFSAIGEQRAFMLAEEEYCIEVLPNEGGFVVCEACSPVSSLKFRLVKRIRVEGPI